MLTNIANSYNYNSVSEEEYLFVQFIFTETQESEEFNASFILKINL